jgi:seryl-tRNA(Sec) selenium transferase
MHAAHRIPYDRALRLAGARVRQIGDTQQTFDWELEAAITEGTAAVLYVAGSHLPQVALPLPDVIAIARARDVPVIVDAAAQLPPVSNLWQFTRDLGADLAVFSGGKALHGPQASGLMVGRPDLVEAARQNGAPYQRLARAMKVGKEEIVGLVAAVERYIGLDHDAMAREWLDAVEAWRAQLTGLPGVTVAVDPLNEAGQPVPRLHVAVDPEVSGISAAAVVDVLREGDPAIAVLPQTRTGQTTGFWIGPDLLQPGEHELVGTAVERLLAP